MGRQGVKALCHRPLLPSVNRDTHLLFQNDVFVFYALPSLQIHLHAANEPQQRLAVRASLTLRFSRPWLPRMHKRCRGAGNGAAAAGTNCDRTSHVQMSPLFQVIGTLAMDRNDQPKGICEPPMHRICRLCTR